MEYKSLYNYRYYSWKPLVVGETMYGDFHVGSKQEYCLSYFAGNTDLKDGEFEVMLTLKIDTGILPPKEEAYMGTEAIVSNPFVLKNL